MNKNNINLIRNVEKMVIKPSTKATLGGTPYDVFVNDELIGRFSIIDKDDFSDRVIDILYKNKYKVPLEDLYDLAYLDLDKLVEFSMTIIRTEVKNVFQKR